MKKLILLWQPGIIIEDIDQRCLPRSFQKVTNHICLTVLPKNSENRMVMYFIALNVDEISGMIVEVSERLFAAMSSLEI